MSTNFKFYKNNNGTPIFEIGYENGEAFYLMPFRGVNFQMSMSPDGFGSAGNSSNMYFGDVGKCLDIGMNHADGYWASEFAIETMRKIIIASAREAIFDHYHCSYGSKHKDSLPDVVTEVYGYSRDSEWNNFISECYKHFGVNTKWDE